MNTQRDYKILLESEMNNDPFEILGLDRDATYEEISKAYKKLAKKYHPDRNPDDEKAEKMFKIIQTAYETLTSDSFDREYEKYNKPSTGKKDSNPDISRFLEKKIRKITDLRNYVKTKMSSRWEDYLYKALGNKNLKAIESATNNFLILYLWSQPPWIKEKRHEVEPIIEQLPPKLRSKLETLYIWQDYFEEPVQYGDIPRTDQVIRQFHDKIDDNLWALMLLRANNEIHERVGYSLRSHIWSLMKKYGADKS